METRSNHVLVGGVVLSLLVALLFFLGWLAGFNTATEQRYDIYCSPCHGLTGNGDGMIVRRGYRAPPSYHTDRMQQMAIGHFYDVISNGFGAMPDYKAQIAPRDRWAIAAYVRALQLSQHAVAAELTPEERQKVSQPAATGEPRREGEHK